LFEVRSPHRLEA